jgi:hypothetical protein
MNYFFSFLNKEEVVMAVVVPSRYFMGFVVPQINGLDIALRDPSSRLYEVVRYKIWKIHCSRLQFHLRDRKVKVTLVSSENRKRHRCELRTVFSLE